MPPEMQDAGCDGGTTGCCETDESRLRRAYFAHAGELALRYGVCFERLMDHLREAWAGHPPHRAVWAVRHMDDLLHAIACVDGNDLAWRDLVDQHERALVRTCRQWLDATEAIVFVRRLLTELRRGEPAVRSLRSFDGAVPLRRWLGDRIMGRMSRAGLAFAAHDRRPQQAPARPADGDEVETSLAWPAPC